MSLLAYQESYIAKRARILSLYDGEGLAPKRPGKSSAYRHWSHGYQLRHDGKQACGSSIGDDEVKLFCDIAELVPVASSLTIGVAFGFSLFTLAIAAPDSVAVGLDNYSDHRGEGTDRARALVERLIATEVTNARLVVGTSPDDTARAVAGLAPLSLLFIDGEHTDEAAARDFHGARPFLDERSVILWHDTPQTPKAFKRCQDGAWDTCSLLRTYRRMGIYYNRGVYPELHAYLTLAGLAP